MKAGNLFARRRMVLHPGYEFLADRIASLPECFARGEGKVIFKRRNELRLLQWEGKQYVVKAFHRPSLINSLVYGTLRAPKAVRSYEYARAFLSLGVGSPQPVAWMTVRRGLRLAESYYVSLRSICPFTYEDLFTRHMPYAEDVLREVARVAARLHDNGYAHKDFGRLNILFDRTDNGKVKIELVDLNRMYRGHVGLHRGCHNLERLPATPQMHRWLAEEYAKERGFDAEQVYQLIRHYRSTQPGKIDGKY